jgi:hypothetical protein
MLKNKLSILALASILTVVGCDVLDQAPQQSVDANTAFENQNGAFAVLQGAYSAMQGLGATPSLVYVELAGDYAAHSGSFPSWAAVDRHTLIQDNAEVATTWNTAYSTINVANNVIVNVPLVNDAGFTATARASYVAQAKVIRASAYLLLVRYFGRVPLVLTPTVQIDASTNVSRATTEAEVYTQIIADLTDAYTALGDAGSTASPTVTGWTARALRARANLAAGNYAAAEADAKYVIDNGPFTMASTYAAIFEGAQASSESIWELQFNTEDTNPMSFWALPNGAGGRREYAPTQAFIDAHALTDTRFDVNIKSVAGQAVLGKYFRVDDSDKIVVTRLAEMYLIHAEAIARQTPNAARIQEGLNSLNVVRARAGVPDRLIAEAPTGAALADLVIFERGLELALEGHRWFDLKRNGDALAIIPSGEAFRLLWPIPQRELQANPNIADDQNDGY